MKLSLYDSIDGVLILLIFCMLMFGLVMVTSSSMGLASVHYGSAFYFGFKQGIFIVMSFLLVVITQFIPLGFWEKYSVILLGFGFLLLFVVLFVGQEVNGSVRWLPLGVFNLQVSEVVKICIVLYVASYLCRRQDEIRLGWWGFVKPMLVMFAAMVLLLAQPDFGSVVVLMSAVMGMMFMAGVKIKQYMILITLTLIGLIAIAVSQPYRLRRLTSYMDPWADQYDGGYQLTQSLIAFGRGGWFGQGLGNSIQKMFYLPEAHTDFIFAIVAEELGLMGSVFTIFMLTTICCYAFRIGYVAEKNKQFFSGYLGYGIAILLAGQVFINLGVNSGLLPTKGLALPFISYGGSSLLMSCLAIGLLLRIGFECKHSKAYIYQGGSCE